MKEALMLLKAKNEETLIRERKLLKAITHVSFIFLVYRILSKCEISLYVVHYVYYLEEKTNITSQPK